MYSSGSEFPQRSPKRKLASLGKEDTSGTSGGQHAKTPSASKKPMEVAAATAHSLTDEMRQIICKIPHYASTAIGLLDLYLCLWECYVIHSAHRIRLEEEHRLLHKFTTWLESEDQQRRQVCDNRETLLWDRRQAYLAVHQGVLEVLQSSERPCRVAELP
ncbi:uncharacterized protein N7482_008320 [Penicillium canariense]|uniref:Uncharacterized protein n=1 Tax=Penicillium canariense TaxID=189055 RepID=A0A9W9HVS3_9EURO|nr:uncharacterized protein N7482_008320 [Penicillium canariense]KAJ5157220.1 hypothetical protein N7482_008320 [Penicillium canariense]